jgi:hypothetical protein
VSPYSDVVSPRDRTKRTNFQNKKEAGEGKRGRTKTTKIGVTRPPQEIEKEQEPAGTDKREGAAHGGRNPTRFLGEAPDKDS